jgi:NitT/TauT family transport system permease protein
VGSYIAVAIERSDLKAIGWAIVTMLVVILLYDQLLFRPLVAWIDGLRFEQDSGGARPTSWALTVMQRSRVVALASTAFDSAVRWTSWAMPLARQPVAPKAKPGISRDVIWIVVIAALAGPGLWHLLRLLFQQTTLNEALHVGGLALITMVRVFVLIALASVVWVPLGVWIGLRPRAMSIVQPVAQFLAAFPANLLFPIAVYGIVTWKLNADVWLSPLMILGTQWYILFNVIAGATAIPTELKYAATNMQVRGWLWWKTVGLPGVFPYYVTGAITASGGSWNAAIVAEYASWGKTQLQAHGLGAYIAEATAAGDFHRIVLGIATMSLFVVAINHFFWRPLYYYAERRYRLG